MHVYLFPIPGNGRSSQTDNDQNNNHCVNSGVDCFLAQVWEPTSTEGPERQESYNIKEHGTQFKRVETFNY